MSKIKSIHLKHKTFFRILIIMTRPLFHDGFSNVLVYFRKKENKYQ